MYKREETIESKRLKQMKQSDRIEYMLLRKNIEDRWDMGNFIYYMMLLVAIGLSTLVTLAIAHIPSAYVLFKFIELSALLLGVAYAFQVVMWIGEMKEKRRLYAEFEERCFNITPKK